MHTEMMIHKVQPKPGEIYYYKAGGKLFGAVFLFRQRDFWLVSVSEKLAMPANQITAAAILDAPLYTAAWFSDVELLSARRIHRVGRSDVTGDYTNRAGLHESRDGGLSITNVGQSAAWKHTFRAFALRDAAVGDTLSAARFPKSEFES